MAKSFIHLLGVSVWLLLSLFGEPIAGQPTAAANETIDELVTRAKTFPTSKDVAKAIVAGQPPVGKALFWAGLGPGAAETMRNKLWMKVWAKRYGFTLMFDPEVWNPPLFFNSMQYTGPEQKRKRFSRNLMKTFAERTSGTAYLMMADNTSPPEQGYFWTVEWPVLRDQNRVDKIVWVDANRLLLPGGPPDPATITRLWWKRGDQQPATYPGQAPPASLPASVSSSSVPATPSPTATSTAA